MVLVDYYDLLIIKKHREIDKVFVMYYYKTSQGFVILYSVYSMTKKNEFIT